MKVQFLNSIPLTIISGGNIYNKHIIEGLQRQNIQVDYATKVLDARYDITIVDSLFMKNQAVQHFERHKPIIGLIHQMPVLDKSTLEFYRTNAKFIVTGNPTKQKLIRQMHIDEKDIATVHPGLPGFWEVKKTHNAHPKRIILVANYVRNKGFEMLIQILEDLALHDLEFCIIGNNTLDNTYAETIVRSIQKTKAHVEFHFNISNTEVYHLMMSADIFLSLSKSESFGMAIFEALALGMPCVAYKTGDVSYFEQYENYIKVEDFTKKAFISALEALLGDSLSYQSYCQTMTKNKREWPSVVNEFSAYLKNSANQC